MSTFRIYRQGLTVGWADFRQFWTVRSWFFGWMLRILTNAVAWVLLGRLVGSETTLRDLLVGNAVAAGCAAALWASNATTWARYDGVHPLLVIAPGSALAANVGRTSVWFFNGIATSLVSFVVLFAVFGHAPDLGAACSTSGIVVLACASSFWFATWMGALLGGRTRFRNLALDLSGTLLLTFCGASVPIDFWPAPWPWIALALPMTHGLAAVRLVLGSGSATDILRQVELEIAVAAGWALASMLTAQRVFDAGRADGSIELV